jgi:transposase
VRSRSADGVAYLLFGAGGVWRQGIDAVAIDPHRGYHKGIVGALGHAIATVDCFHGVKVANAMVDHVRRRVQQESLHHRGHKDDPLYRTRRRMTRGFERLSPRQTTKLFAALAQGDPDGETGSAIFGRELLRAMYAAQTLREAHWRLVRFYDHAADADVPELTRLAKTVSAWETEILNYHVTGISNGPVEVQNLVTE